MLTEAAPDPKPKRPGIFRSWSDFVGTVGTVLVSVFLISIVLVAAGTFIVKLSWTVINLVWNLW